MNIPTALFGERSLTLVAAVFATRAEAQRALGALRERTGESSGAVSVIAPDEPDIARRLEPDQAGIWHTMLRSHGWLGLAGSLAGLLLALLLVQGVEWPAAVSSPRFTTLVCTVFGAIAGMLLAGLLTLRPDHALVIRRVRSALGQGRVAVVAHPHDEDAARRTSEALAEAGGEVLRSV